MTQASWQRILEAATALALAACAPLPPHPVPLAVVPAVTGNSCNVTLVRKKQSAGSAPSHYIFLDTQAVASLEIGEYTSFPIAEGRHTLVVAWRVGDRLFGIGGFGAGAGVLVWSPYAKSAEVDCRPPMNFFFTMASRAFPRDENDRVELNQVEQLDGDFILERNRHVPPGAR